MDSTDKHNLVGGIFHAVRPLIKDWVADRLKRPRSVCLGVICAIPMVRQKFQCCYSWRRGSDVAASAKV